MKRIGVIVGVDHDVTPEQARELCLLLEGRFPGVVFAIGVHCDSVAFEIPEPPAPGYPL